jgi:hypothetical protein
LETRGRDSRRIARSEKWNLILWRTGLPDFSLYNIPKWGKNTPNDYKIIKCPLNLPSGQKIFQINIFKNILDYKVLQNIPKLLFLVLKETIWQPWWRSTLER